MSKVVGEVVTVMVLMYVIDTEKVTPHRRLKYQENIASV